MLYVGALVSQDTTVVDRIMFYMCVCGRQMVLNFIYIEDAIFLLASWGCFNIYSITRMLPFGYVMSYCYKNGTVCACVRLTF